MGSSVNSRRDCRLYWHLQRDMSNVRSITWHEKSLWWSDAIWYRYQPLLVLTKTMPPTIVMGLPWGFTLIYQGLATTKNMIAITINRAGTPKATGKQVCSCMHGEAEKNFRLKLTICSWNPGLDNKYQCASNDLSLKMDLHLIIGVRYNGPTSYSWSQWPTLPILTSYYRG